MSVENLEQYERRAREERKAKQLPRRRKRHRPIGFLRSNTRRRPASYGPGCRSSTQTATVPSEGSPALNKRAGHRSKLSIR